jgi:hypothetical protein
MPRGYPIGEITAYGSLAGGYWHAPAGREVVGGVTAFYGLSLSQDAMTGFADARAR